MKCIHNKSYCSECLRREQDTIRVYQNTVHVVAKTTVKQTYFGSKCYQGTPRLGKHKKSLGGILIK